MKSTSVGVPTVRSMGNAFATYAKAGLVGVGVSAIQSFLGGGVLATLAGPIVAGSILKGPAGDAISAYLGLQAGMSLGAGNLGGLFGVGTSTSSRGSI